MTRPLLAQLLLVAASPLAAQRPLGSFADDYGSRHVVSDTLWSHDGRVHYAITRWDTAGQFLIARNADSTWSRIDWMALEGMAPWKWGFCIATWNAPTVDSAASTMIARRESPRTGCNGFPFTRLKPAAGGG
jgi:hypothetical protein